MNARIHQVWKESGLTMEKFGARIGIKTSSVSMIVNGKSNPSDQTLRSICREFDICEMWLRTGEGPMRVQQSRFDELESFVADLKTQNPDFRHRLLTVLVKLRPDQWELLEEMALSLYEEVKQTDEELPVAATDTDDFPEDIEAEVEAYRQELLAEKELRDAVARADAKKHKPVSKSSGEKLA